MYFWFQSVFGLNQRYSIIGIQVQFNVGLNSYYKHHVHRQLLPPLNVVGHVGVEILALVFDHGQSRHSIRLSVNFCPKILAKVNALDFHVLDSVIQFFCEVENFKLLKVVVYLLQSRVEFTVEGFLANGSNLLAVIAGN
jgi:hypothetical protein